MNRSVCLSLFNERGVEIYCKWYSSTRSAQSAKVRLNHLFRTGYTWVIWTFNVKGVRLLLSSSRPLAFQFVENNPLL